MNLQEINWPVYKLGTSMPSEKDGILFYMYGTKKGTTFKIVDDRNLQAESLAGRRLKLLADKVDLFKLKYAFFFLGDFIKVAKANVWFIDALGRIFKYTKSKAVPLICRKITKIIPSVACTIIEVEGIPSRFKVLFSPTIEEKYVGLLQLGKAYIVYGLYSQPFDRTVRRI